jgi:DNA/RNA-binding domain of Phe-tRNA-synthetase-like protein
MAYAIPVAVFDVRKIEEYLEVRHAAGSEVYLGFSGETENPEPREVIFADSSGRAHARRWTNRQSGYSAVGDETSAVLIVAEAVHASALINVHRLMDAITVQLDAIWSTTPKTAILKESFPRFEF